ncbi:hypothetical protein ACWC0C_45650 [Streptomyces sp. NPDC001709]
MAARHGGAAPDELRGNLKPVTVPALEILSASEAWRGRMVHERPSRVANLVLPRAARFPVDGARAVVPGLVGEVSAR